MSEIPLDLVYKALEQYKIKQELRPYLGYSMLGHKCSRYLWYYFRWMFKTEISPRQKRLFSRGDQEEFVVVKELQDAGIECFDHTDNQIEVVGTLGHVRGHPDGTVRNVPGAEKTEHNLEIKTANEKRFKEMVKFGIQRSNPEYYAQSQCYMNKKKQTRTLFVVTNKNTDERYYERIKYDKHEFDRLDERAFEIISSPIPPPRLSDKKEWFECKWCDAYTICHGNEKYERNCRTCNNVKIKDKGEWHCSVYNAGGIPINFQRTGCADNYRPFL